jgi:hypothetical protein
MRWKARAGRMIEGAHHGERLVLMDDVLMDNE